MARRLRPELAGAICHLSSGENAGLIHLTMGAGALTSAGPVEPGREKGVRS